MAIAALLFAVWVAIAALFGPQDADNPLPGVFYVLLWVGLVALSLAVGPVWRVISPVRTVHRLLRRPIARPCAIPSGRVTGPRRSACSRSSGWSSPAPTPDRLARSRLWLLRLPRRDAGRRTVLRRHAGVARADPFEVYSVVASRLSPLRRNRDGRIAIGNPFDHLPSLPVRPGTVAVLAVLLGSTAFDSFSATPQWRNFVDGPHGLGRRRRRCSAPRGCWCSPPWSRASFWLAARATGGVDRRSAAANCPG